MPFVRHKLGYGQPNAWDSKKKGNKNEIFYIISLKF